MGNLKEPVEIVVRHEGLVIGLSGAVERSVVGSSINCPELRLAGLFVNRFCAGLRFAGKVEKSAVSKNLEVPFSCPDYTISAESRGKEVKLNLSPASDKHDAACIVLRFGMSGSFKFTAEDDLPKHAHLRFYTKDFPRRVLSFVDPRRFGSWEFNGSWQPERGPCVMTEYEKFRENVLKNLSEKAFDKPICEALLNQKYFNGIGNYLRAEILYRLHIPPFTPAREVLEDVKHQNQNSDLSLSKKIKIKKENPDLLQLCHLVPLEVIDLGGKGYDPENSMDYAAFGKWLQCYFVSGMKTMKDSNGRTIWFKGDPGPLAPKGRKVKKPRKSINADSKPVKVEKTTSKRKARRESSTTVKQEQNEELDGKAGGETTAKRKRGVKVENVVKEEKTKNGQRAKRILIGKKTSPEPERVLSVRSARGSARKTPLKRGRATQPQTKDAATPKTKPQRLKSDSSRNSPKPRPRRIKPDTNSTPRNSPKVKTRAQRKSALRDAEGKS
ncbi:PREDICTED: endonuclease 8-like 1 [Nanorana parkeri]|uniref:endonuclease 8-like 1 n=1 Tax=Nanorana parkeri TaxID=125878 RepID=UPI000854DEC4|nr:PREDICTED: endonuclease 8-like 1 [Nanorana parkeri]